MALYTRSQFAKICGKTAAHVSVAINRDKTLVLSGDYIDDQHIQNAITKKKWQDQTGVFGDKENAPVVSSVAEVAVHLIESKNATTKQKPLKKIKTPKNQKNDEGGDIPTSIYNLDVQKKQAEVEYKQAQIRKLKIEEAKLRGQNIPTSIVNNVVFLLGHSFMSNYKNGANQLFIELSHKAKIPTEVESEFKGRLIELINLSHKNAVEQAKMAIRAIIEEHSTSIETEDEQEDDAEINETGEA